ncbi:MAG: glycosyltransferase family 2 protein [Acidimicrobiales bacterium]|nr:glycosyltransferase family 2 protein [Acidimicrobiales bacterium]
MVTTFGRSSLLTGLVAALEAQDLDPLQVELVLVDNGSTDDTWAVLSDLVARSPLPATALRLADNHGPAPGRNAGVAASRSPLVAITDDDCLPTPGWLRHVRLAFAGDVDVVQGAVHADPAGLDDLGPWDHTIWVTAPTPFFETCNVSYRRRAFERAGGFDEADPLLHPPSGRAFGEDACLAWEVQRTGGKAAFTSNALVHHRCLPGTYARWLADQRQLGRFPGLARRSPLVARWLTHGVFLSPASARFDLAVVGVAASVGLRARWPLLATLPWARRRWGNARHLARSRRDAPAVLARLAWSDVVALGSMAAGSVRYRRVVL